MSVERGIPQFGEFSSFSPQEIEKTRRDIEFAQELHEFVDPNNHIGELSERIKEGTYPILYSNHTQHFNIAALMGVVDRLPNRPEDMYIAVADSLLRGEQGESLGGPANKIRIIMEEKRMHMLPMARPKDIKDYKEKKFGRETIKKIISETKKSKEVMESSINESAGFMFFPEATTEGGMRKSVFGKRKGLQEVNNNRFEELIKTSHNAGRDIAFLPIGIVDANKILEPRRTKPTLRAVMQRVKTEVGMQPSKLAKVVIGEPFDLDDLSRNEEELEKRGLNDFMMRRVAELLPEEARGYYR